ncbi:1-(5-phosphoribosyl)-5-[(5-phosphoribosylamino)methylideneamino] imidazole-4-carboxamide isomerase [Pyrobaculum neutrophilum]|uniref:1-(5-phosphoribosyl)-5-[(5-phosphoribosylamino)methylideneamino] imidazole-4-carboxamide isomerase n=1 Tax=Pyrobaculum neutrophilum (strain DSM 2338 / JCM 9278 / NBRC 100436 / V24Sta) TaxID=444157 RepID=B1YAN4_PYRNV|nr:1-(5-phosphoribosyl)-5-[(5-phosphoribosylamino)methylideneamino] imidazole-4-carboxamide isomerase [Pyrobaculum neutrophilum]ACB39113.1 histidine biosynthesis protein [Pyrobaculum neutrophilum V24Sta]
MIIPSIDIEGGRAVKRVQGRRGEYIFVGDPLELARRFSRADLVHVVDLDGAEAGRPVNTSIVEKVARELGGRCQLGGGLRSAEAVEWALSLCRYAVVGSMPFKNPSLFASVAARYRSRLVVSLDVRGGFVVTDGWTKAAATPEEAAAAIKPHGPLAALVITSVDVEGTGAGFRLPVDLAKLRDVAARLYYAGGVNSCVDVEKALKAGFDGVIVGYALYRGDLKNCAGFIP